MEFWMVIGALLLLIVGGAIYLVPTIVAHVRDHRQFGWLLLVNILTGWTTVGWVGCLVWAAVGDTWQIRSRKTCPRCAEDVRTAAQVCRFCGHEFQRA